MKLGAGSGARRSNAEDSPSPTSETALEAVTFSGVSMHRLSGVEKAAGAGFLFVPAAAVVTNGEFVDATENTGRTGVSNMLDDDLTGVRSGMGDDDGGKRVREWAGEVGGRKSASSSSIANRLERRRLVFSL